MAESKTRNANMNHKSQRIRIKAKLEGLKSCYRETINAFQTKVDAITLETLNKGSALLSASYEDVMVNGSDILNAIDRCSEKLIDINLLLCEDSLDENDSGNETKVNMPGLDKTNSPAKNNQLPAKPFANLEISSGDGHSFLFNDSICGNQSTMEVQSTDGVQVSSMEPISTYLGSDTAPSSPSLHIMSMKKTLEQTEKRNVLKSILDYCEKDHMEIVVCDVSSPGLFGVQLVDWMEVLFSLQQDINDFYSDARKNRIENRIHVGMICIAIFPCDQCWYRAQIQEILPNFNCRVYYVDYGNTAEVKQENLRRMAKDFEEVPKLAVNCRLHGIVPKNGIRKWPPKITIWFNQFVYGQKFLLKIHNCKEINHTETQSVSLFDVSKNDTFWNVSTSMLYLGLAMAEEKCSCCYPEEKKDILGFQKHEYVSLSNLNTPQPCTSNKSKYLRSGSSLTSVSDTPPSKFMTNCNSLPASAEGSPCRQILDDPLRQTAQWQGKLKPWDPMFEDFASHRNNYSTDVDNACVAVENINWDRIMVCKHYLKGDCWLGRNCKFSHPQPDTLYQQMTFSFGTVPTLEFERNSFVYVKVTHNASAEKMFYGQILCFAESEADLPPIGDLIVPDKTIEPNGLELLTNDMKQYYSQNRKRLQVDNNPFCGEMYVVIEKQKYCRATVISLGKNNSVKVCLFDYGYSFWVQKERLFPFCQAFIHLPVQAVLFQIQTEQTPVFSHVYMVQIVGCDKICDGPVIVSVKKSLL